MPEQLKADVSHKVKKIEVFTKRLVSVKFMGIYKSSIKGRGLNSIP